MRCAPSEPALQPAVALVQHPFGAANVPLVRTAPASSYGSRIGRIISPLRVSSNNFAVSPSVYARSVLGDEAIHEGRPRIS
jgi:hypothetical protein